MPENKENLLKDYLSMQLKYVNFTNYMENKIRNLLIEHNIRYQAISSRVKTYESLEKKLTPEMINGIHNNIVKMNDLSGVRIIFYNENEMELFLDIIYNEFNKIDIKYPKESKEYDGINVTVGLQKIERFEELSCEIQLTTVLSHSMNEFGHDILYKDVGEIKNKSKKEYEELKEIFEDARKNIISVSKTLDFISKRAESIKKGTATLELIIDPLFVEHIKKVEDLQSLEKIVSDFIDVIPLINDNSETITKIIDGNIIYEIVKKFVELPDETEKVLNYDTYEYKFEKVLEFLLRYMYLWMNNFSEIIELLNNKVANSKKQRLTEKFYEFIKKCMKNDKVNGYRKVANYNIHNVVYDYIINDDNINNTLKMVMATEFCNFKYSYSEETEVVNQLNFVTRIINPNDNYIKKIKKVIEKCCSIFIENQSYDNFSYLIAIIKSNTETEVDSFKATMVYDTFSTNYENIDDYYKSELYASTYFLKKTDIKKSAFYKKLKADKFHVLYCCLFSNFFEEIPGAKYKEKDEYRYNFIEKYINDFSEKDICELKRLLSLMKKHKSKINNIMVASSFLIELGSKSCYSKKIYIETKNEYILIGILNADSKYKFKLSNKIETMYLIEAMIYSQSQNMIIMDNLIRYVSAHNDFNLEIKMVQLIFGRIEIFKNDDYRLFAINIIKKANLNKKSILQNVYYRPEIETFIVNDLKKADLTIILKNYNYCYISYFNERLFVLIFEKYPGKIRRLIQCRINEHTDQQYYQELSSLQECRNFKEEIYNNLLFCVILLKKNRYYEISHYIKFLLGDYDNIVENCMLDLLDEYTDEKSIMSLLGICRILFVSVNGWKVYEKIITVLNENSKLLSEIDCLLFDTGVVSGEFGVTNSFNSKKEFFKKQKSSNIKVKKFIARQIKRFDTLYCREKMDTENEIIQREVEHKLNSISK